MLTIIVASIVVLLITLTALSAWRKSFIWSAVFLTVAIVLGLMIFWSNTEISGDGPGVAPAPTAPASPVAAQRNSSVLSSLNALTS